MRKLVRRSVTAALLVASAAVATGGIASAHDHACELRLRGAPIETAELPEGWRWDFFTLEDYGSPSIQIRLDAGGLAVALDIACTSDPEGLFLRLEELRQAAGNSKISVVHIGDESQATREFSDFPTIRWRHGDVVGLLRASDEVDYGDMEAFALEVDAVLP